ncbi:MAG: hypothetical protein ACRED4_00400, partial [Brevundimonas sp.]
MIESPTQAAATDDTAQTAEQRPDSMAMTVQSGMLRTLGINLYTSLGKVLVEFIANAYDSDATKVDVTIPDARIKTERDRLRAEARATLETAAANDAARNVVPDLSGDGVGSAEVGEPLPLAIVAGESKDVATDPTPHAKFD